MSFAENAERSGRSVQGGLEVIRRKFQMQAEARDQAEAARSPAEKLLEQFDLLGRSPDARWLPSEKTDFWRRKLLAALGCDDALAEAEVVLERYRNVVAATPEMEACRMAAGQYRDAAQLVGLIEKSGSRLKLRDDGTIVFTGSEPPSQMARSARWHRKAIRSILAARQAERVLVAAPFYDDEE
jgi:hypothetical protein